MDTIKTNINSQNPEYQEINITIVFNKKINGGNLSITEQQISYEAGAPPSICNNHDKVVYIIEGRFRFFAGGRYHVAEKGASLFIPKGTLHSYKNVAPQTGKVLVTLTPAGANGFLNNECDQCS